MPTMEIPGTPLPLFAYAVLILVWFLVARPGATSSIQPSSEINGRHTYQAQTLEAHTHTPCRACQIHDLQPRTLSGN